MVKRDYDCDKCNSYAMFHQHYDRIQECFIREYGCFVPGQYTIVTISGYDNGKIKKVYANKEYKKESGDGEIDNKV